MLALAAISGIADVDAITLSMTDLARGNLGPAIASLAILVALAVNTITKALYALIGGGRPVGVRFALISGLALAAGTVAFVLGAGIGGAGPGF